MTRYDFALHPSRRWRATFNIPSLSDGRDCQLGTEGGKSYVAARGALRWLPTDDLEININGDVTRDSSEAAAQTLIYVGTANATTYTPGTTGLNLSRNYPMYSTAATNGLNLWNADHRHLALPALFTVGRRGRHASPTAPTSTIRPIAT